MILSAKHLAPVIRNTYTIHQRCLWAWLNPVFNKVDEERIKAVGPDRACAEWLIRCGAAVKWKGMEQFQKDYNLLPTCHNITQYIKEIDATDAAIMHIGFRYLKDLKYLDRIIFRNCIHVEDTAIENLVYAKNTLKHLQISSCGNVTSEGLKSLQQLNKLETLLLFDLPEVRNKEECKKFLLEKLPRCKIEFPYALANEVVQE